MDAGNAPVRRAAPELHTDDIKIVQKPLIQTRDDLIDEVIVAPEVLQKDYLEALAFAEEPVTIRIERTGEKFAPKMIDLWVNGKGAEIVHNGRWVETRVLPVGVPVTTKRKYVEVLARSKLDTINTLSGKIDENSERNDIERFTSSKAPFSVIRDDNPKGIQWLQGIVSQA
jgi:hypothetical protein